MGQISKELCGLDATEKVYSRVLPEIKKRLFIRGMILGGAGCFLILFMGIFPPLSVLSTWGLPSFFLGIFFIAWGLIPYKKLTRLETHPHKLLLGETEMTFISTKGGEIVIPYDTIEKIEQVDEKHRYGLMIKGENNPVFLPYFLHDSRLNELVHPDQSNNLV